MPNILSRAELLLQAKNYSGTGAWLDESGNSHDAQLGSTSGVDANDPEFLAHSGDNYVRLPGSSGNYVSSADTNLLDADTAHLQQSKGEWLVYNSAANALSSDQAYFGDTSMKVGPIAAAGTGGSQGDNVNPALPDGTYTVSVWVYSDTAMPGFTSTPNKGFRVLLLGDTINSWTTDAHAGNGWQQFEITFTAKAGGHAAGVLDIWVQLWDADQETTFYFDAACLRAGSDGTFVPSLRIVGDSDVRVKAALDDWTPASDEQVLLALDGTPSSLNYALRVDPTGVLEGVFLTADLSVRTAASTVATGVTDGAAAVVRHTLDISSETHTFYVDGVQLGATVDTGTKNDRLASPNGVEVGSRTGGTAELLAGKIYYAELRDGIDGPVVARFDADDAAEPFATQTGATDGRSWTYNRSGAGLYVVDQPAFGLHTDDYFEVADHADLDFAANESLTVLAVVRASDTSGSETLVAKKQGIDVTAGYALHLNGSNIGWLIADGAAAGGTDTIGIGPARTLLVAAGRRDTTADEVEVFKDGTGSGSAETDNTTATMANANTLRIGRLSGSGEWYLDGEIMAVALFREALTDDEIAAVGNALAGLAPGTGEYTDQEALGAIRNRLLYEGTHTEATAPRELVGALNAFLGTTSGDVEGALNEKIGSGYVGVVQACNTLLAGAATVYEENDGLRKLAELYVP